MGAKGQRAEGRDVAGSEAREKAAKGQPPAEAEPRPPRASRSDGEREESGGGSGDSPGWMTMGSDTLRPGPQGKRPDLQSARGAASGYLGIRWAGNRLTIHGMVGEQSFFISDADD